MRPVSPQLAARLRRAASKLRYPVECHAITAAAIKQTQADWLAGDGPPSGADFEFVVDGGLRLASTIAALISSTTGSSFFTDLNNDFPYSAALISWGGTDDANREIMRVKASLHPNQAGTGRAVAWWRCRLYHVLGVTLGLQDVPLLRLAQIAEPLDVAAAGDAAGEVTFDYSALPTRPRPKALGAPTVTPGVYFFLAANFPEYLHPCTIAIITAHAADGSAVTNVGWGYDNTIQTFGTGNVLRSALLKDFPYSGIWAGIPVPAGTYGDTGTAGGVPKLTIETGSFTQKIITFSAGNLLDLGAAPTGPVYLASLADTPPGTSVTYEIRNDADTAWVVYVDGQTFTELGLTATQTRKVRATLTPNGAGSLTPILRKLGMEEKTVVDLSHVAHIVSYTSHVDPVTLQGRITTATLRAVKNGRRDFQSTIEDLLTTYDLVNLEFRWYVGETALPKSQWTLIDSFVVVDDFEPGAAAVGIELLGANALISARLPKYDLAGSGVETPDSTVSNPDGWTDQAGGAVNIHLTIDEAVSDDTDYVQSPASPTNDAVTFGLSNLADPNRDTGHFVDFRCKKDATGGEVLTLGVELLQGATQKMVGDPITVPDEWTDFSLALSAAQAQSVSDYTDLRLLFRANVASGAGARRVQVSWAQLRVTGQRAALVYTNQAANVVYADLLNQAEVPTRHIGPGVTETLTVSKTITDANAADEADALAAVFGRSVVSSQGRIVAVDFFDQRAPVAHFPEDRVIPLRIVPGFRERRPRVSVAWNWSNEKNQFDDEAIWQSTVALTKLGPARVDAEEKFSEEAGKYVYSGPQAKEMARRTGEALATGLMLWQYRTLDPWPELELADAVTIGTTRFLAKDPHAARALRGQLVALARLTDVSFTQGVWEFTGWLTNGYADIFAGAEAATLLGFTTPTLLGVALSVADSGVVSAVVRATGGRSVKIATSTSAFPSAATVRAAAAQALDASGMLTTASLATLTDGQTLYVSVFAYEAGDGSGGESLIAQAQISFSYLPTVSILSADAVWKALRLFVQVYGNTGVASFKVATSTSAFPAAGTGTVVEGQDGIFDAGVAFVYANLVYVTITPYPDAAGAGVAGPVFRFRARQAFVDTFIDDGTGKPKRAQDYTDGKYALIATDTVGETADALVKESGAKALNRLFAKPLAADPDTFDSVGDGTTYKRVLNISSGLVQTTSIAGLAVTDAKINDAAAGKLTAGNLIATINESSGKAVNRLLAKPLAADPDTLDSAADGTTYRKVLSVTAGQVTQPSLAPDVVQQMAEIGTNLALNGGWELGTTYWRRDPATAGTMSTLTVGQLEGATSGYWTCGVPASRLQQCDRTTPVDDSTTGTPLYLPVQPLDEVWGSVAFNLSAAFPAAVAIVVEEYDAAKAFLARTTLASTTTTGTQTLVGGVVLGSTTRYVVLGFSWPGHAAGGGFVKIDAVQFFRGLARRRCLAYKSGAVQSLTTGTEAAITFDAETYDIGPLHDVSSNTARITVPAGMVGRGGIRLVGQITFAANATGYRRARWKKNNTTFIAEEKVPAVATASQATVVQCVARDNAPASGDYYELWGEQNSGGALNVLNGTREVTFGEAIHDY
jgi:hypothetical protein